MAEELENLEALPIQEHITKAQVAWLTGLLCDLGPKFIQVGYVGQVVRMQQFVEDGLKEVEKMVINKRMPLDDDIPF